MFLPKFAVHPAGAKWTSRDGKKCSFLYTAKHTTAYHNGQGVPSSSLPPLSFMNYLSKALVAFHHTSNKHPQTHGHFIMWPLCHCHTSSEQWLLWTVEYNILGNCSREKESILLPMVHWNQRTHHLCFGLSTLFQVREVPCSLDSLMLTTRNQTGWPREKDTHCLHLSAHFLGLFIYPQ